MFYWLKLFVLEDDFIHFGFVKWRKENKTSVNFQSTNSWSWVIGVCLFGKCECARKRPYRQTSKMNRATSNQQTPNEHFNSSLLFYCSILFLLIHFTFDCVDGDRWKMCAASIAGLFFFSHFYSQIMIENIYSWDDFKIPNIASERLRKRMCAQISPFHFKTSYFDTQIVCGVCLSNQTSDVTHTQDCMYHMVYQYISNKWLNKSILFLLLKNHFLWRVSTHFRE